MSQPGDCPGCGAPLPVNGKAVFQDGTECKLYGKCVNHCEDRQSAEPPVLVHRTQATTLAEGLMNEAHKQMDKAESYQNANVALSNCYFTASLVLKSICGAVRDMAKELP